MKEAYRWTIALALLVSAAALAGCLGSDASSGAASPADADGGADDGASDAREGAGGADDEASNADDGGGDADESGNETTAAPSSMSFSACDVQVGVFEVPAALAAEEVPPGFEPTSVVEPAGPTASFIVDAHACGNATSDAFDAPVEDVGWVIYFLAVDPPDEYEAEDVDFYFIPVAGVADSPKVVDVYEAWNLTFEDGTVDLTATTTPAGRAGELQVRSETISSRLHTAVSSDPAEGDPDHRARIFDVSDGEVTSIVQPTVSASSRFLGGAERVLEAVPSDPGEVPFWAAENARTTGVGQHFIAERIDLQPLDPAEVAGG